MKTIMALIVIQALSMLRLCMGASIKFSRMVHPVTPTLSLEELPEYTSSSSFTTTGTRNGTAYFPQWLNHDDPSEGTFQMQYWWNAEFWAGPGSPVVFFTPGESAAGEYTGYLTKRSLIGLFAREVRGALVMAEHRYWGNSSPFDDLTTRNLQYLTQHQAIHDFTHFARSVKLPFDTNGSSNAAHAPWLFSGGSYAGALAAWTASVAPGTFWAYHASSAPVEAIDDYWQYFVPVQQGMPKNCSRDIERVVEYLDDLVRHGNASAKYEMKMKFGMESIEHDDDFMRLTNNSALQSGPSLWQSNNFSSGYSSFYEFCDAIENVEAGDKVTPDENGVGLGKALAGYAKWTKETLIPGYCEAFGYDNANDLSCFDSYNGSNLYFTNRRVDNAANRQWYWMLCNEPFGYWPDGAPVGRASIVSRLVTAAYWQRQCRLFFPSDYIAQDGDATKVNERTGGWQRSMARRVLWTNGQFDPWRTSGMSSEFRSGGAWDGDAEQPLQLVVGGFHCPDLHLRDVDVNPALGEVVKRELVVVRKWMAEFYEEKREREGGVGE